MIPIEPRGPTRRPALDDLVRCNDQIDAEVVLSLRQVSIDDLQRVNCRDDARLRSDQASLLQQCYLDV